MRLLLCFLLVLVIAVNARDERDDRDDDKGERHSKLHDHDHIHDKKHIEEHLDGMIENKNTDKMTDEELNFYYFKTHDYDNNNLLDGIELRSAVTHTHAGEEPKVLSDKEIAKLIDDILFMDDTNDDGYINYAEFMKSQKRAAKKKEDKR